jgi:hypothetical protein
MIRIRQDVDLSDDSTQDTTQEKSIFDEILDKGLEFSVENCVKRIDDAFKIRTTWEVRARGTVFECAWAGFESNEDLKRDLANNFHNVILPHIVTYDKNNKTLYMHG